MSTYHLIDKRICEWLMENADIPIRYRLAREILQDDKMAKGLESALLNHPAVQLWLKNLKPHDPPQHKSMEHGCFDFCLEQALPKVVRLGLHGGFPQVVDAVNYYIDGLRKNATCRPIRKSYTAILVANLLCMADIKDNTVSGVMLKNLDELYSFARCMSYDIYITGEERTKLKRVPKHWAESEFFLNPEPLNEYGYYFPLIHDLKGLYKLYGAHSSETDKKINTVIEYISNDDFHSNICLGYGILTAGKGLYHSMGADPRYPGWFDVAHYIENSDLSRDMLKDIIAGSNRSEYYEYGIIYARPNMHNLLVFAEYLASYPPAWKTKWLNNLLEYFEKLFTFQP